jgi:hypothetical protein
MAAGSRAARGQHRGCPDGFARWSPPQGSCPTGKNRYPDAERAAEALELAGLRRDVEPWRQEKRCYPCPLCGGFHLTSQGLWRAPYLIGGSGLT